MDTTTVTIKEVEEPVYRKLRAVCVEQGIATGTAATEAFREWLAKKGVVV